MMQTAPNLPASQPLASSSSSALGWRKMALLSLLLLFAWLGMPQGAQAACPTITTKGVKSPPSIVVGKRTAGAELASFYNYVLLEDCGDLRGSTIYISSFKENLTYNQNNTEPGTKLDSSNPSTTNIDYTGYACPTCGNSFENLKFTMTRIIELYDDGNRLCGSSTVFSTEGFANSNAIKVTWPNGTPCTKMKIEMRVRIIQTANSLLTKEELTFRPDQLPQTSVSLSTNNVRTVIPSSPSASFKLAPSPSCTFAANSQNLQVVLGSLQLNNVDKTNTSKALLTKPFSLNLTSCTATDQARKVNLTWTFNKPNPNNPSRLSNQKSDGSKGVDVMVIAADNQKMALDTGTAYADLTIKNLETYRALNNASNVSLNFKAAFVANGEEPAPGICSSTATVMLSYE